VVEGVQAEVGSHAVEEVHGGVIMIEVTNTTETVFALTV